MIRRILLAAVEVFGACAMFAQGTLLLNPGEFSGPTVAIDFETFPGSGAVPFLSLVNTQWAGIGVLIGDDASAGGRVYDSTYSIPPHSGTHAVGTSTAGQPGGSLEYTFIFPGSASPAVATQAGLWIENGDSASQVSFFDAHDQLIRTINTAGPQFFVGLRYDVGIRSIRVTDADYFITDDVQFGPLIAVPEPNAGMMLVCFGGMLALWGVSRSPGIPRPPQGDSVDRIRSRPR